MSLWSRTARDAKSEMLAERTGRRSGGAATGDGMRNSAVWAGLRLRAELISTMPLDVFRKVNGIQVEVTTPPVLLAPGGPTFRRLDWMYATQLDLDRYGNAFGIITARDGAGLPARIELVAADKVTVVRRGGVTTYQTGGKTYDVDEIWHERQYPVAGLAVGLSPIAYAALALQQGMSAQQFATSWFTSGNIPVGHLRNTAKKLKRAEAIAAKASFQQHVEAGEVWASGNDWEFKPVQAAANDAAWLSSQNSATADIARFLGVPSDLIDAAVSGSSITYANITQRNLQFLVMNLGPAITRREDALSYGLLPAPRFVKLNTDALLRMDPQTRSTVLGQQIRDRMRTPSEVRELENLPPFTDEQFAEFDRLFSRAGTPKTTQDEGARP